MRADHSELMGALTEGQSPEIFWIGCVDSRVSPERIIDCEPGQLFVHRNIANLALPGDTNYLSSLQYSIDILGVKHVIVCGHTGCGGIEAAFDEVEQPYVQDWIQSIQLLKRAHREELSSFGEPLERASRLAELNVQQQVSNISQTSILRNAWHDGQDIQIHGLMYHLDSGILKTITRNVTEPL